MKIFPFLFFALALMVPLSGADFGIDIGNQVAAQDGRRLANAILAVRSHGCEDSSKAHFEGVLTYRLDGERSSTPLLIRNGGTPGVYAVGATKLRVGHSWVMVLTGECMGAKAGALISIDDSGGYSREMARFFSHTPSEKEIEAAITTWKATSLPGN